MTQTLPRARCCPQLEILEDRLVPSVDMVIECNDFLRTLDHLPVDVVE